MNINQLILLVKSKIEKDILTQDIKIEDKTFLHKKHLSHQKGKFHLKINIFSKELTKMSKIKANKKVYSILEFEIKEYIHSIQILIN
jgi:BolA protein